jgi:hypothetical protein
MQKNYKSGMYDEIINCDDVEIRKELYKKLIESNDYIFNADVTSLYPSIMNKNKLIDSNVYPVGASRWSEQPKVEYEAGKLGIYKIKFQPPKNIRVPILPRHKPNDQGIFWELTDGDGIYSSVDIKNAVDCGYQIEFIEKCLVWDDSKHIFNDYIEKFSQMKKEAEQNDQPIIRSVCKLLLNSLYGKMLQRANYSQNKICKNAFDINDFTRDKENISWIVLNDNKYMFTGDVIDQVKEDKITKPTHIGVFVLSYSRMLMTKFFKEIDPTLQTMIFTYTDTDSMHIFGEDHKKLFERGLIKNKNDAELGLLTNDVEDEGLIIYEKNLGPKMYTYTFLDKNGKIGTSMKAKGIPKKCLKKEFYENEKDEKVKFWGMKKKNIKLSSKDKENGIKYLSIIDVPENIRTFYKNQWEKMNLVTNQWFPVGYEQK